MNISGKHLNLASLRDIISGPASDCNVGSIVGEILHEIGIPYHFWNLGKRQGATGGPLLLFFSAQRFQLPDLLFGKEIPEVFSSGIKVAFDA